MFSYAFSDRMCAYECHNSSNNKKIMNHIASNRVTNGSVSAILPWMTVVSGALMWEFSVLYLKLFIRIWSVTNSISVPYTLAIQNSTTGHLASNKSNENPIDYIQAFFFAFANNKIRYWTAIFMCCFAAINICCFCSKFYFIVRFGFISQTVIEKY